MAAFVDGEFPYTGPPASAGPSGSNSAPNGRVDIDLGPLVGVKRGFKTKERVPFSGGMGGVEMCSEGLDGVDPADDADAGVRPRSNKGKGVARGAGSSTLKGKGKATVDESDAYGSFFPSTLDPSYPNSITSQVTFSASNFHRHNAPPSPSSAARFRHGY